MRIGAQVTPGLNSNDSTFTLPMQCTDANNIRWADGRAQPIGGWVQEVADQLEGVCRNVFAWRDHNGNVNLAFGTHSHLYVYTGGTLYDVTPVGLAAGSADSALGPGYGIGSYGMGEYGEGDSSGYFARTWSLQIWGQMLIANPRGGTIYVYDPTTPTTPAAAISNAPAQVNAILVTPQRQILALGCNEEVSEVFNPLCVRGCATGDYDDWSTSLTGETEAFERILEPGGGGRIVNGKMVGAYVGVWTDQGLFLGDYVASGIQIYRFDLVATNCGLAGPNAAEVVNQRAWWMTPEHLFYTWAPGEAPSLIPCPIRDDFKDRVAVGQDDKIAAAGIGQYGEIWFFYPDSRDGLECSRYLSLNIGGQSLLWSRGVMARSAATDAGSTQNPIFVSPDGWVYAHENGQDANGAPLEWSFTITLPYIDEAGRSVVLQGIEPDIKNQVGAVSLSFALRSYPNDETVRSKGPFVLAPGQRKRDFQFQGRLADMTFSGNSAPTFAQFGKQVLLAEIEGEQ